MSEDTTNDEQCIAAQAIATAAVDDAIGGNGTVCTVTTS